MTKFQIEWTEETFYRAEVEADSEDEAREKFWSGEYNHAIDGDNITGGEIQDSIDIREVDQMTDSELMLESAELALENIGIGIRAAREAFIDSDGREVMAIYIYDTKVD